MPKSNLNKCEMAKECILTLFGKSLRPTDSKIVIKIIYRHWSEYFQYRRNTNYSNLRSVKNRSQRISKVNTKYPNLWWNYFKRWILCGNGTIPNNNMLKRGKEE